MIIYKTTNLINGKIYIGQDSYNNPKYYGSGRLIIKAFKKHGIENFRKDILEFCVSTEHLNEREIYWIACFNSTDKSIGYNIEKGGKGVSFLTKKKMSEARVGKSSWNKGIPMLPKTKEAIIKALKGKPRSEEIKKKIGDGNRGKKHSLEQNLNNANLKRGTKASELTKQKLRQAIKKMKRDSKGRLVGKQ